MSVMTVTGPISPDELGVTFMHEHVLVDNSWSGDDPLKKLDDVAALTWEMKDVIRAGGKTIVDCTCIGLGTGKERSTDPLGLRKIAKDSGINIIASTGFYRNAVFPEYVFTSSTEELTRRMITDCLQGIGNTGVRPGMLAEFSSQDHDTHPDESNKKIFRAASRTHKATGLPITTHSGIAQAEWQIAILREEGVPLDRVVLAHITDQRQLYFPGNDN